MTVLEIVSNDPVELYPVSNDAMSLESTATPVDTVVSVNGKQGVVTLDADDLKAVSYEAQTLTDTQKAQARTNIDVPDSADDLKAVSYEAQTLTDTQKAQARTNIDVPSTTELNLKADKTNTYTKTEVDGAIEDATENLVSETELTEALYDKADVILNTASGSIASFDDGSAMPIKELVVDINAVQDLHGQSSPYPAGGGKNILNPNLLVVEGRYELNADQSIKVLGSDGRGWASVDAIPLKAGTYYIRFFGQTTYAQIRTSDDDYATLVVSPQGENEGTFTLAEDGGIKMKYALSSTYPQTIKPIISTSSITAWSPYENICPISGWDAVNVVGTGKNLFDPDTVTMQKAIDVNGNIIDFAQGCYTDIIPVITGETYVYSGICGSPSGQTHNNKRIHAYVNGVWLSQITYSAINVGQPFSIVFTIPSGTNGIRISAFSSDTDRMVELDSTATSYEPYNGTTYPISLGQTVYGGVLDATSGVLRVTHAIVDLGTLNWNYNASVNMFYSSSIANLVMYTAMASIVNGKCTQYIPVAANGYNGGIDYSISVGYAFVSRGINVKDSRFTNAADFKTAVSGVMFTYPLDNPIEITLSDYPTIETIKGVNNLWADSGDVAVIYRADTKAYIDGTIVDVPLAMIAPIETGTTASKAYAVGEYFILNGNQFCKAKTAIASGATFTLNTNYTVTTIGAELKALA